MVTPSVPSKGALAPTPRSLLPPLLSLFALLSHSLPASALPSSRPFIGSNTQGEQVQSTVQGKWGKVGSRVGGAEGERQSSGGRGRRRMQTSDPCAQMPRVLSADKLSYFVPPTASRKCLDTVTLDIERVGQDIDSIKKYFQELLRILKSGREIPDQRTAQLLRRSRGIGQMLANLKLHSPHPGPTKHCTISFTSFMTGTPFSITGGISSTCKHTRNLSLYPAPVTIPHTCYYTHHLSLYSSTCHYTQATVGIPPLLSDPAMTRPSERCSFLSLHCTVHCPLVCTALYCTLSSTGTLSSTMKFKPFFFTVRECFTYKNHFAGLRTIWWEWWRLTRQWCRTAPQSSE